jgi:hypothetical protein
MDDLNHALEEFRTLQRSILSGRSFNQRPRHYNHAQRVAERPHHRVPRYATHYQPQCPISIATSNGIYQQIHAYSACATGLPISFTPDEVHFIIDTGASITITFDEQDFDSPVHPVQPTTLKGIASGLSVKGIGDATYSFTTSKGDKIQVTLKNTLYVPDCKVRLLCPRHLAACTDVATDGFNSIRDNGILTCYGHQIEVPYHVKTGLPIIATTSGLDRFHSHNSALHDSTLTANTFSINTKQNLTPSQHMKLLLHERCNHKSMSDINRWIRQGLLPVDPSVANSPDPICAACRFGKAHKKSHCKDTGSISASHTYPGSGVSADQLEAGHPGRLPTTKGLPTSKRYRYCNFWVDHHSKYIFPTFHESKDAKEMVSSKTEFQTFAARYNVKIKSIRADNGAYASALFKASCDQDQQEVTYCAVGGHWQNGLVERYIGVITQTARTLLLHAMAHWPGVVTEEFWPFAIRHACTFHNASIRQGYHRSPHHLFTGAPAPWKMDDFRVFGCPVFVLDKRLQDGDNLQKWKARSWLGIYIGHSLQHVGNVPVIYNPITTHISPQFHVVFDDSFTTVSTQNAPLSDSFYQSLYDKSQWLYKDNFATTQDFHTFNSYWSDPPLNKPILKRPYKKQRISTGTHQPSPEIATPIVSVPPHSSSCGTMSDRAPNNMSDLAPNQMSDLAPTSMSDHAPNLMSDLAPEPMVHSTPNSFINVPTTDTSSQTNNSHKDYINLHSLPCSAELRAFKAEHGINADVYTAVSSTQPNPDTKISTIPIHDNDATFVSLLTYSTHVDMLPLQQNAAPAYDNKNDILTQSQMLKAEDSSKFVECQTEEIKGLYDLDIMDIKHISNLPANAKLLSSIWIYRRKRLPNGMLLKYKSRLCVNGKEQCFGRDYWETYAPVASWSTIRLLLILSTLMGLQTRQVDYTLAFPQATLDVPVYMKVPQGWLVNSTGELEQHANVKHNDTDHYLLLKKNLYGCKQAARNWFKTLTAGLLKEGFTQSKTDHCLFLRSDCIIVVYVDDCLFFSPNSVTIDNVIASLSRTFKLKDEGNVSAFLGIQITKK